MTLEKAIETLTSIKHVCRGLFPVGEQEALSLGIEALKAIREMRHDAFYDGTMQLPGETEE